MYSFTNVFPFKLLHNIKHCYLCYTVGLCWWPILNVAVCTWIRNYPFTSTGQFSSVQSLSRVPLLLPHGLQSSGFPVHHQLTELTKTHVHWVMDMCCDVQLMLDMVMSSNHLTLCHPLLLLPSIFPSIRVFSNESVLYIRWSNIGVSASVSIFQMNIQDLFPLGWTDWISLLSKGLSRVFSNTIVQ